MHLARYAKIMVRGRKHVVSFPLVRRTNSELLRFLSISLWIPIALSIALVSVVHADDKSLYRYFDGQGSVAYASTLDDIPPSQRDDAMCIAGACAKGGSSQHSQRKGQIFHYTNKQGRDVYTDTHQRIPLGTPASRLRLDTESLNPQLAREIENLTAKRHRQLRQDPLCTKATNRAAESWWATLLRYRGPWIFVAFMILVLLMLTPRMLRKVEPPAWGRLLAFAIPTLVWVGLVAQIAVNATELRQNTAKVAKLCDPASLHNATHIDKVGLVQKLRKVLQARHKHQAEQLDDYFSSSAPRALADSPKRSQSQ